MKTVAIILSLACVCFHSWAFAADTVRPNVVLFLVDDMGWMDSTPYGSEYYQTPNMQRLAGQSMRFTDAYALPLCSPTRASIMTGQYSSRHGITSATGHLPPRPADFQYLPATAPPNQPLRMPVSKNYLDPSHYTLAETLRDAGYRTGHFGKWHLGLTEDYRPDKHGFETVWHCAPDPGPPSYFSPYGVHPSGEPSGRHRVGNITDGPDGEHIADRLTSEAIAFITEHQDEPFYLNLWHYSVHGPWQHKEAYTRRYSERTDPRGEQANPVMGSMLQSVDESLGRLLDTLERLGLAENTLFIFYSDNGGNTHSWTNDDRKIRNVTKNHPLYDTITSYKRWAKGLPPTNNAPLREGKGKIYEGGQRVPLMVRFPGRVQPGTTSDAIVGPIDLYPTILDALTVPRPQQQTIDGVSFLSVLRQTGNLERDAYFTWFPHLVPGVSVRAGNWKLIRRFQSREASEGLHELYDLENDLGETTNLAEKFPEKVSELNGLIDRFVEQTGALYPAPNPDYQAAAASPPRSDDPLFGLVPKFCAAELNEGMLRIIPADGKPAFLGTAQVRVVQPIKLRMRLRSRHGGTGQVWWKSAEQPDFPDSAQRLTYDVDASDQWQDVEVSLPIESRTQIVRVYVPASDPAGDRDEAVEIESIQFVDAKTDRTLRAWDFSKSE